MPRRIRTKKPRGEKNQIERFRALLQYELYFRRRQNELTEGDYFRAMNVTEDDKAVRGLLHKAQYGDPDLNGASFSWDSIITWVSENWLTILKTILLLAPFFLQPKDIDPPVGDSDNSV